MNPAERLVAVPNISEGRATGLVRAMAGEACLLDLHSDPDHNRSVITYGGAPDDVVDACIAMARRAVESLDLTTHAGLHPRRGVVDVVPFVDHYCDEQVALDAARRFADAMTVPVFFYERADIARRTLPQLRRVLNALPGHATAGSICVGVRGPLIAFNVNVHATKTAARTIVRRLRDLDGVRALAFEIPSKHVIQISMNLTRPQDTGPRAAFDTIAAGGVEIVDAEIVGLVPRSVMDQFDGMPMRTPPRSVEDALAGA